MKGRGRGKSKSKDKDIPLPKTEVVGLCSPTRTKNFEQHNTCYTQDELVQFAKDWNVRNVRNVQNVRNEQNVPSYSDDLIPSPEKMSIGKLYEMLRNRYGEKAGCKNEVCWIKESPSMSAKTATKDIFRPLRSDKWRSGREWLNTNDIMHVMKQYEPAHPDFMFLGVFPVDFEQEAHGQCVVRSMCDFKIKSMMEQKKKRFGMVINLDKHDQPGSHWVAVFCCIDPKDPKYGACYFDSGGSPPEPIPGTSINPIIDFLRRVKNEVVSVFGPEHEKLFWVRFNPDQKQFKNTECGMFCLLFNILCLEKRDADYKAVRDMIGYDDFVHQFRKIFFAAVEARSRSKIR